MNEDPTVLLSPQGQEVLARLADPHAEPHKSQLALAVSLRREYPPDLVAAATAQHELRLAARAKFSRAVRMLFTRAGYEQSSSAPIAAHRAGRLRAAARVADLCCGIGGDLIALAAGREVLAVDRDEVHARLAVHNAGVYNAAGHVRACVADVRDIRLAGIDAVFIDPARRYGRHRFRAGVSDPPLDFCLSLAERCPAVCIKAAPGLPIEVVPDGWEAEFIADGKDLKEAVLWSPVLATAPRRATILPAGDSLAAAPGVRGDLDVPGDPCWPARAVAAGAGPAGADGLVPAGPVPVGEPGEYLLDPNPAVTRAGLVADLARRLGAWQIDPRIAFLAVAQDVRTPFARTLRVVESAPWNEKLFARRLRDLGVGAADLRRRGLAGDVERIHRRLKLAGPHRATVVLTRVRDRPWGLICADPGSPLG